MTVRYLYLAASFFSFVSCSSVSCICLSIWSSFLRGCFNVKCWRNCRGFGSERIRDLPTSLAGSCYLSLIALYPHVPYYRVHTGPFGWARRFVRVLSTWGNSCGWKYHILCCWDCFRRHVHNVNVERNTRYYVRYSIFPYRASSFNDIGIDLQEQETFSLTNGANCSTNERGNLDLTTNWLNVKFIFSVVVIHVIRLRSGCQF